MDKSIEESFIVIKFEFYMIHFHGGGIFLFTIFFYILLAQWILLIKSTCYDLLSVIFCCSSLKKKLKDKMAEFQVGDQTFSLDRMFSFHCSYAISNLQFLKLYADLTGSYPSRILRGCWEACLYRFEPSCYWSMAIYLLFDLLDLSWKGVNLFESLGIVIVSNGHKSWWRGEICSILENSK